MRRRSCTTTADRCWEQWHPDLRDHWWPCQKNPRGHPTGSWYFDGDMGSTIGGRLYITAFATMILEVYYRHMPIYSESAVPRVRLLNGPNE